MTFLNPGLLGGMLAIILPIVIHFWYQKKGKTIAWAASQWLTEKTSLKHRGIRLDEIPLLLIRCLLVILLSLLLSKPIIHWLTKREAKQKIHLVQANAKVADNFRFELETALKRKEKVFLISQKQEAVTNIASLSGKTDDILLLQQNINQLAKPTTELHLYLVNAHQISHLPKVYIPGSYRIHSILDSASKTQKAFAGLQEKLGGEMLNVLIDYKNSDEQQTVQAGLSALTEVYAVAFNMDKQSGANKHYDLIFTDQKVTVNNPKTLYISSAGSEQVNAVTNVIAVEDSLRLSASDVVRNGQLPEWIGDKLIEHFDLTLIKTPLSKQQFESHFESVKADGDADSELPRQWILLLFILLLMLERWIALKTNLPTSHV